MTVTITEAFLWSKSVIKERKGDKYRENVELREKKECKEKLESICKFVVSFSSVRVSESNNVQFLSGFTLPSIQSRLRVRPELQTMV